MVIDQTPPESEKSKVALRLAAITAQRFRSLYEISLPLKPLNIIIGPNGSGKSNLIRLLRLVRDVATDPRASQQYEGIARNLVWYGREEGETIYDFSAALTLTHPQEHYGPFQYTVDVSTFREGLTFPRETLADTLEGGNTYLSRTGRRAEIWKEGEEVERLSIFTVAPQILALQYLSPLTGSLAVQSTQRSIARWRFFEVDISQARRSTTVTTMQPERVPELSSNADNLSEFLHALQALQRDDFEEVVERMRNAIEFLEDMKVEARPTLMGKGATAEYRLKERAFVDAIPPQSASDGTIRLLAIMSLLLGDRSPSLVCLEEPDHNLHPHLMLHLADTMRYVATSDEPRPQLLVTTHSPDFLNCFDPDTEADCLSVFVAHKDPQAGKTSFRLVDSTHLAHWLREYRLGELHKMGLLDSYARGER